MILGEPEAVVQTCSVKKCFLKFHKIHRKTPVPKKETLAQVFSCEFCFCFLIYDVKNSLIFAGL